MIKYTVNAWNDPAIALIASGSFAGFFSLLIAIPSWYARHITFYDDKMVIPLNKTIAYDEVRSVSVQHREGTKISVGIVILTVIFALLLQDSPALSGSDDVYTLHMKIGEDITFSLHGFSKRNRKEIVDILKRKISFNT